MSDLEQECSAENDAGWVDRQGDVWTLGTDGLMHTPETRPFPREYVEKKWGPLRPTAEKDAPKPIVRVTTAEASGPSGAGERGGERRNPRLDSRIKLSLPHLDRRPTPPGSTTEAAEIEASADE